MKVITAKLTDELHTELRIYTLTHGTTTSELVKKLIEKELAENEREKGENGNAGDTNI